MCLSTACLSCVAPEDAPQQLTIDLNTTSVSLQWLPPTILNGGVDQYVVTLAIDGATRTRVVAGDQTSTTIDNLAPYQSFNVEVAASNEIENSLASGPSARMDRRTLAESENMFLFTACSSFIF